MKKTIVGVDIAKLTFDAEWCGADGVVRDHFDNDDAGIDRLVMAMPRGSHVVMEATGTYYLRLATRLRAMGYKVTVENPAKITYFARMKLMRTKTDPKDAGVIRRYGEYENELTLWQPMLEIFAELNQLDRHIVGLQKDLNQVGNRIEALRQCVTVNQFTLRDLEDQRAELERRIQRCEHEIQRLVIEHFGDLYHLIRTIPGVGAKTAIMFIVLTEAFTRFPSAKKFAAYLGMTSFIHDSGTSVKGSGAITKMGHARMRQLLYMAALTARSRNKACRDFAARLRANGKPVKVIRVAVANKLIRQVFALFEKQEPYSENFA